MDVYPGSPISLDPLTTKFIFKRALRSSCHEVGFAEFKFSCFLGKDYGSRIRVDELDLPGPPSPEPFNPEP